MVRLRALVLLLVLVAATLGAAWLAGPLLRPTRLTVLTGLTASLAWALVVCWAWLALATALLALETAATGAAQRTARLAPRLVRVVAATVCGASLTVTLAASGSAEPIDGGAPVHLLDGLTLPERVATPPVPDSRPVALTVRPGDTLWDLAQEHGVAWPLLYRANRAAIGADPDLIQPGMRLVVPSPSSEGADRR